MATAFAKRTSKAILRASDTPELSYEAFFAVEPDRVDGDGMVGSYARESGDQRVVLLFEQVKITATIR